MSIVSVITPTSSSAYPFFMLGTSNIQFRFFSVYVKHVHASSSKNPTAEPSSNASAAPTSTAPAAPPPTAP
ncbi:hypothetical protein GYMLUDRAFT_245228 [Collybiopsis luxurians FD-317 M1]|uniref:Uncharacterized protein n=1 Tax=Collybiopsis luxurians FD-317 M1 TaxID=944289 RepID=A0A0D0CLV6_9AGAR|nr:hypothetical protein GYMLUDRAFT_245228 [Collybiopsis luxurians FD-317 M1]